MSAEGVSTSEEDTQNLGKTLGALLKPGDVVLLTGDLGAGKTQFAKGIALALGIKKPILSPTFNIVLEYREGQDGRVLLRHFDLYRLEKEEELDDIDYFGMLEDDVISVVEWGDKFSGALPEDYLLIDFVFEDETTRTLRYGAAGKRGQVLLGAVEEVLDGR
jgi:tRNA threonylcarbamoyladenosine biosynthesis protein TsaE